MLATIEPKKRRRLTCSKCDALAIPHSYTQREHHALHQVLPMTGHRIYVCTTPNTLSKCGRQRCVILAGYRLGNAKPSHYELSFLNYVAT